MIIKINFYFDRLDVGRPQCPLSSYVRKPKNSIIPHFLFLPNLSTISIPSFNNPPTTGIPPTNDFTGALILLHALPIHFPTFESLTFYNQFFFFAYIPFTAGAGLLANVSPGVIRSFLIFPKV